MNRSVAAANDEGAKDENSEKIESSGSGIKNIGHLSVLSGCLSSAEEILFARAENSIWGLEYDDKMYFFNGRIIEFL